MLTNTFGLPCICIHIKYTATSNTYTYLAVNAYYADLFNLDSTIFTDKDVGFLDSLALSTYSDISLLMYLTHLGKKQEYNNTISLTIKQNNITKTVSDTISLMLFGKEVETNEYIIVGFKDNYLTSSVLEPTADRIIDNLPIYIYWKDYTGKYLGSNNSLSPYLAVDEPVFTSLDFTSNTISYYKYCDNIITSTKKPLVNIVETHLIAPEGKKIHVRANKIPIIIKDFIIAILYTYEDITELLEQLNLLNETKELLYLKEQQYQELLDKTNNNNDTNINNLFNTLSNKSCNEKELIQLELLLNRIEEQVKILYEKVYTSDNSLVSELAKLKQNQEEDLRNFTNNRLRIDDLDSKISNIQSSINFLLFFKNLTAKQILLFGLVISVLFTYVSHSVDSKFIKKIIDNVEKLI
jgi:hypothetical protein